MAEAKVLCFTVPRVRDPADEVVPIAGVAGPPSTRSSTVRIAMLSNAVPVTLSGDNTPLRLDGESIVMPGETVSLAGGVVVKNSFIGEAPPSFAVRLGRFQFDSIVARTEK